jgi:DNA polymerase
MQITLDFETFYGPKYTLRTMSYTDYVTDDRFKIHCCALKVDDQPSIVIAGDDLKVLRELPWGDIDLVCHNALFDGFILHQIFGVHPRTYRCTMAMARAVLPMTKFDLDSVGKHLKHGGKLAGGRGLLNTRGKRDLTPEELGELVGYCAQDNEVTYLIDKDLAPKLSAQELHLLDMTQRLFCEPKLFVDTQRAEKELARLMANKEELLVEAEIDDADVLSSNDLLADLLRAEGVDPPMKYSAKQKCDIYAFAKGDEGFKALLTHPNKRVQNIVRARIAHKSTIGESRAQRMIRTDERLDILPMGYNYCAAHTKRWGGTNKMNPQNLPRGGELRKSILAPDGYVICTVDAAQIEARLTAWRSKEEWKVQAFRDYDTILGYDEKGKPVRKGPDSYRLAYAKSFDVPLDMVSDDDRQIGKVQELALGFGGAVGALQSMARLFGLDIPDSLGMVIVENWRKANPNVEKHWDWLFEKVMVEMFRGMNGTDGVLSWGRDGRNCYMVGPSGLPLWYLKLNVEFDRWSQKPKSAQCLKRTGMESVWRGLLCENEIQYLARDVVAEKAVVISGAYDIVMMTHDEISYLARIAEAEEALDFGLKQMAIPPTWAPDLPVAADGKFATYYCK